MLRELPPLWSRACSLYGSWAARSEADITLFEFITVAVSIVLSFGVVRLLEGSLSAFHRSKAYPVHCGWVLIKFLNHFVYWWSIWQFRENIDWNFLRFLIQALPAVILYLQATVLVTSTPQAVPSWREHYYSITPVFFALNILYMVSIPAVNWLTGGVVFSPVENSLLALGAVLSVGGMVSRNPRLHWVVLLVFLVLNTATVLFLVFAPAGTPS